MLGAFLSRAVSLPRSLLMTARRSLRYDEDEEDDEQEAGQKEEEGAGGYSDFGDEQQAWGEEAPPLRHIWPYARSSDSPHLCFLTTARDCPSAPLNFPHYKRITCPHQGTATE